MVPPFISYITFNRLGLTVGNLSAILSGAEDFEMYIIDCNSKDDTWDYIMSLEDSRIKAKEAKGGKTSGEDGDNDRGHRTQARTGTRVVACSQKGRIT